MGCAHEKHALIKLSLFLAALLIFYVYDLRTSTCSICEDYRLLDASAIAAALLPVHLLGVLALVRSSNFHHEFAECCCLHCCLEELSSLWVTLLACCFEELSSLVCDSARIAVLKNWHPLCVSSHCCLEELSSLVCDSALTAVSRIDP